MRQRCGCEIEVWNSPHHQKCYDHPSTYILSLRNQVIHSRFSAVDGTMAEHQLRPLAAMPNVLPTTVDSMKIPEVMDICHQLGYSLSSAQQPPRGPPSLLLDEMNTLADTHACVLEPTVLADIYLSQSSPRWRHHYFVYSGPLPAEYLTWDNDRQR